jgi:hypothetical protein
VTESKKDLIALEGKSTYSIRGIIKARGGKWSVDEQKWYVPAPVHKELMKLLKEADEHAREAGKARDKRERRREQRSLDYIAHNSSFYKHN